MKIERTFTHRKFGTVGMVELATSDDIALSLDGHNLPEASIQYLLTFALQSLQDSYAGAKSEDEARGSFAKKLKAILEGTMGVRGSGNAVDEVTKVARQLARAEVRRRWSADKYRARLGADKTAAETNALLDVIIERNESFVEKAKAEIVRREKAAKELAALDVDLDLDFDDESDADE